MFCIVPPDQQLYFIHHLILFFIFIQILTNVKKQWLEQMRTYTSIYIDGLTSHELMNSHSRQIIQKKQGAKCSNKNRSNIHPLTQT